MGLGGLDANLRQLEGHKRTAIVPRGLPTACAILKMLDEYALWAILHHVDRNLSDVGRLRVVRFAHDMVLWHFRLTDMIVADFDIATKNRAACKKDKVVPAPHLAQSLEYCLCTNLHDNMIDIGNVECFFPLVLSSVWRAALTRIRSKRNGDAGELRKQQRIFEPRRFSASAVAARHSPGQEFEERWQGDRSLSRSVQDCSTTIWTKSRWWNLGYRKRRFPVSHSRRLRYRRYNKTSAPKQSIDQPEVVQNKRNNRNLCREWTPRG